MTQVQIWDGSEDETGSMSYGNMVQIKHGEELTTLYAHLSEINVQEGDTVVRGQRIGRIGDTGNATGAHLHFEFITSSGRKVSPDWLLASDIIQTFRMPRLKNGVIVRTEQEPFPISA